MMTLKKEIKSPVLVHRISLRSLFIGLAGVLIMTACNPKKVEREKDEGAVETRFDVGMPELKRVPGEVMKSFSLFSGENYGLAEFQALDLQSLPEWNSNRSRTDRENVLMTLAPFVLLPSNLSNQAIVGNIKFNSVLHRFNRELISLMESSDEWRPMEVGSDESRDRMIVEQYIDLVEYGCSETFLYCSYDHVFRKDSLSSLVLVTYLKERWGGMLESRLDARTDRMDAQACLDDATCTLALSNYYRYLRLAISLRSGAALESELAQAYLQYGQVYAYFMELDKARLTSQDPGFQWSEWRQQHTNYYKNALAFHQNKKNARFIELVTRPEVFLCHREDPRPFCMELLKEGAQFIQCQGLDVIADEDCDRNGLHKNFVTAIQQMQSRSQVETDLASEDPSLGVPEPGQPSLSNEAKQNLRRYFSTTYSRAFNEMSRGVHKHLLATLEIEKVETVSIPFYLTDSLFHGRLHPTDATLVWNAVERDARRPQDLDKTVTHYLKLEVARLLAQTNEYMTRFYNSRESYDTQVMVARAIEESREISTKWFELNSRIERIRDFVEQSLRDYDSFARLNETLQSISKNVKYLSVYPNMMILSYFMANEKFELTVRTWFGSFTIDANGIISAFFEGNLRPWFLFGGDNTGLHKYQILLSFFYALQTETFDVYERLYSGDVKDELKSTQVNIVNFFKAVMGEFLVTSMKEIEKGVLELRAMESHNQVQEARRLCGQMDELTSDELGQELDVELWSERLGTFAQDTSLVRFSDLNRSVFAGVHGASANSGVAGVFGSLYSSVGGSQSTRMLKEIRTNLAKRFIFFEVMVDFLKIHYEHKKSAVGNQDLAQLKKMDNDLREIQRFIDNKKAQVAEVATRVFRHEEVFGDCLYKVISVQRNRMKEIFRQEQDYATQVHGLMSVLRKHPSGGDALLTDVLQGWDTLFANLPRSQKASAQSAHESLTAISRLAQTAGQSLTLIDAANLAMKVPKSRIQKWLGALPADFDSYCTDSLGAVQLCGLDTIVQTGGGTLSWNLHKVDFYFRLIGYFKDGGVGPNLSIIAPAKLAEESSFKNREVTQVYYQEDPVLMHRQVLQLHGDSGENFTSWVRSLAGVNTIRHRLEFLSELYRVGEQPTVDIRCLDNLNRVFPVESDEAAAVSETGEAPENTETGAAAETAEVTDSEESELVLRSDVCPIRGTKELSVKTLIQSQINLLVTMGLDEEERHYLRLMGRDYFFEKSILQGLFLEPNHSDRQESLLERIFVFMKDDKTVLAEAQSFYEGFSSIGYLLFPLPDEVQCRVRNRFKNLIEESYFSKLDDYLTYTRELEEQNHDFLRNSQIYFEVGRPFDFSLEGGALGLLDPLEIRDYNASSIVFHQRETSGFYLNRDRQFGGVEVQSNGWSHCQEFE